MNDFKFCPYCGKNLGYKKGVIYYVDDEPDILRFAKRFFQKRGYYVKTFKSGEKLIEQMKKKLPDLVISDVNRDGMAGVEFFNMVRFMSDRSWTKILVVSGMGSSYKLGALKGLVDGRVQKPIDLDILEEAVNRLCNNL